ncbi:MAG: glutamate 5-kinase [Bacilli bacterium]
MKKEYFKNIKRIVIKIGTSSLTLPSGLINHHQIRQLVSDIATLHHQGYELIIVTSGAVGSGNGKLGITKNSSLSQKQASAAIGQVLLMKLYEQLFDAHNIMVAQILLTKYDIENRKNNMNARNTINELFKLNIIPIINENDSTVVDELKVGDNDNLGGQVALICDASLYIILSDIDGMYNANPQKDKNAQLIEVVNKVDDEIRSYAKDKGSAFSVGGMATKLEAASIVCKAGIHFVIANGSTKHILNDIVTGTFRGTLFLGSEKKLKSFHRFLELSSKTKGSIIVDDGAKEALINKHSSLLPIGIIKVNDVFEAGDIILISDLNNNAIGKGVSNYSSSDLALIKGLHEKEYLKDHLYKTAIHKDHLVIIRED